MRQFVARFLTLPKQQFVQGIKQLCTKFELQVQCQRGFGESRYAWAAIQMEYSSELRF